MSSVHKNKIYIPAIHFVVQFYLVIYITNVFIFCFGTKQAVTLNFNLHTNFQQFPQQLFSKVVGESPPLPSASFSVSNFLSLILSFSLWLCQEPEWNWLSVDSIGKSVHWVFNMLRGICIIILLACAITCAVPLNRDPLCG